MRNAVWTVLSLSVSGSAMALLLFALRPVLAGRVSKRFGYYVWLLVLLRLCLPVSGSVNVLAVVPVPPESGAAALQPLTQTPSGQNTPAVQTEPAPETVPPAGAAEAAVQPETPGAQDAAGQSLFSTVVRLSKDPTVWFWLWGAGALLTCAWYVSGYLRFSAGVRKNGVPAEGEAARILEELCPGRRPELISCACVDTPMLLRLFRPVIVLPDRGYDGAMLRGILRHELCHYRRGDLYYKWFAMLVFSLHWFNPVLYFVRRQLGHACELACDEAVVSAMSADERRLYGETLLSLAGGERRPAGILATTMCEEKKYLKGRLLGIMHYKKTSAAAVALSLAIALVLCGCGAVFGATESASPSPSPSPSVEITPLTAEEIAWFNTEFFNGDDFNIHNQFIASLYEKPMDVDLYELFYLGAGDGVRVSYDSEEYRAVLAAAGLDQDPDCGCEKIGVSAMDRVLTENMGLTLAGTSGIGLDQMIFVERYDAYYHFHGDTNYLGVTVDEGYRDEAGNVWLKYTCLTWYESERLLQLRKEGDGYLFVSNTETGDPPGSVDGSVDAPETVQEEARRLVMRWFREAQTRNPDYRYTMWRIGSLAHSCDYDEFNGMTLSVYRMNYQYLTDVPANIPPAGGMEVSEDGWVTPTYPDSTYLFFRKDGDTLTFLSAAMINDCEPGDALFRDAILRAMSYAPDSLSAEDSTGVEFYLDYADDDIVVFHGYFGLFVYDLDEQKITNAVDFKKTLGCNWVNGSVVASVAVSDDGRTVQMYLSGSYSDAEEMGLDIDSAWYLDTATGVLTKDARRDLENPFDNFVANQDAGGLASARAVPFWDGNAFLWCSDDRLEDMTYVRSDMLWKVFDGYFD